MDSAKLFRLLRKMADLVPPLGYPGGTYHVVRRIRDELPDGRLEDTLVNLVERGDDLPNSAASTVYAPERERGPWKYRLVITSHAQYRMDLRGVTVPEIRAVLDRFFRTVNLERSRGTSPQWDKFTAGAKITWVDDRLGITVVFMKTSEKEITIVTTYRKEDL